MFHLVMWLGWFYSYYFTFSSHDVSFFIKTKTNTLHFSVYQYKIVNIITFTFETLATFAFTLLNFLVALPSVILTLFLLGNCLQIGSKTFKHSNSFHI